MLSKNIYSILYKNYFKKNKSISFLNFMRIILYSPLIGYYNNSNFKKFGIKKDFITSPELTSLYGSVIAIQSNQILCQLVDPIIIECGAGSGKLCIDILLYLEKYGSLPKFYYILEISETLRNHQFFLIKKKIPHLFNRIKWFKKWPRKKINGLIIANEFLDAFPVHRFFKTKDKILESYIKYDSDHQLKEVFKSCKNYTLIQYLEKFFPKNLYDYYSEVNLLIDFWIKKCYKILYRGVVLIIDYGFPLHEYYHPDRYMGTIMCHYRHRSHTNPLIHLGKQDITSHVNFTQVAESAKLTGFKVSGYTNQSSFLISSGFLDLLKENMNNNFFITQIAKSLLQPHEMGELFKVLALNKNLDIPLIGFEINNKKNSLFLS